MKLFGSTLIALFLVLSLNTGKAFACGDYCDYGGAYATGGYDLYSFSLDLYTIADYSYSSYDYGGSCGTFSGCGSCYDVGLMSGYSGLNNYYNNGLIDWEISSITNQLNQYIQMQNNPFMGGGYPGIGGGYPGMTNNFGNFPGIYGSGYPGIGGGYPGFPGMPTFPTYPPTTNFPTYPTYPTFPTYPSLPPVTTFPTYPTTPTTPTLPTPPTNTPPPYGGCDNIIIPCPSGTVTRPQTLPTPVTTTYNNPFTPHTVNPTPTNNHNPIVPTQPTAPEVYQPSNTTTDSTPIRYKVPRGVRTH